MRKPLSIVLVSVSMLLAGTAPARAQTQAQTFSSTPPLAMERVTFDEAVRRALEKNPTIGQAAEAVRRAEGLLQQARAATMPGVSAGFSNSLVDSERGFAGTITQPRNQATFSASVSMPVLAASRWAASAQARDQIGVATLSSQDVRRQIGVAAAQAYLAIITQQRQVEVNVRARDAAQTHLDYAQRRLAAGAGTRLNELRAAQELSSDEARVENARLTVRRAQEALGVLMAADGPVDAAGEPAFDIPELQRAAVPALPGLPALPALPGLPALPALIGATSADNDALWMNARTDVRLFTAAERAADRVWRDSSKDFFPTATASFDPQLVTPSGAFTPSRTWRLTLFVSQPVFDGGQRAGLKVFRQAAAEASKLALTSVQIQARAEVRLAEETVRSTERTLANVRLSAQQAAEVLTITNTAFEAGATTNLEVIDAQRSARDAETAVTIAEDAVRRARLDLLTALGRFPQ